jgi:hypothetical protein
LLSLLAGSILLLLLLLGGRPLPQAVQHSRVKPLTDFCLSLLDFICTHFCKALQVDCLNACCFN